MNKKHYLRLDQKTQVSTRLLVQVSPPPGYQRVTDAELIELLKCRVVDIKIELRASAKVEPRADACENCIADAYFDVEFRAALDEATW